MNKKTMAILIVVLAGLLVWAAGSTGSGSLAQGGGEVGPQAVLTPLLQYQGRLTDPGTGEAVADGMYLMSFGLYNVESGGSPLWMETKDVSVQGGLFSTVLGDKTPLDQDLFNGQALWLGVKVRADAEATPRQQVLPVAYALSLVPGAVVEASITDPLLKVVQSGTGYGLWGETSRGTAAVLGYHTGSGYGVWGYSIDGYGGYFASNTGTPLYVSGAATMSGNLTVGGDVETDRVTYSSPRTHYLVIGCGGFVPENNVDYSNGGGCGGAYRTTSGALVAPVHLPHGAVVTGFEVFFYDTSSGDMHVNLNGHYLSSCGFFTLADVYSSGTSGYYSVTDTANATINNTAYSYRVRAYSTEWDSINLMIKGAVITYTITEAP